MFGLMIGLVVICGLLVFAAKIEECWHWVENLPEPTDSYRE